MHAAAFIWWATLAGVTILLGAAAVQAVRAGREVLRLKNRIADYADLPVIQALSRAERDGRRIETALARLQPLQARAEAALAIIRRGPIPPEVRSAIARIRTELVAFRAATR